MRICLPLLLALGLLGTASASDGQAVTASDTTRWVRTTRGWETVASLDSLPNSNPGSVAIHPGLIAAGQLCGSLLALVGCASRRREAGSQRISRNALASGSHKRTAHQRPARKYAS